MGNFSPGLKARYFFGTLHLKCLINLGIKEEEFNDFPYVAEVVNNAWTYSGRGRTLAGVICNSPNELEHLHIVAYTVNSTTLRSVSKVLGNAHIEPVLAGKKEQIENYILKKPPWDEKGEEILYSFGLENIIEPKQGNRTDLDDIKLMIQDGATPDAIFQKDIRYLRYEKMILKAYADKRISELPIEKKMTCEWHCGESGTGKSRTYVELCEKYGRANIYFFNDFQNGGLDKYMLKGAPRILFMDDIKPGDISYRQMLMLTDVYADAQTHSRFSNALNLWEEVYVTSIYPIEAFYEESVYYGKRETETLTQLKRRFHKIVYHYINDIGDYKQVSVDAKDYKNISTLTDKALQREIDDRPSDVSNPDFEKKLFKLYAKYHPQASLAAIKHNKKEE